MRIYLQENCGLSPIDHAIDQFKSLLGHRKISMSDENENIEVPSSSSEASVPTRDIDLLSSLRFILGWYVVVFTATLFVWLVRLPFYDEGIRAFLWGAFIHASLSLSIVGAFFFVFLASTKYKLFGYALLTFIVLGALSRCGTESDDSACIQTRYFSTCD